MKSSSSLYWAALAAAPLVNAQWYRNGPDCAQNCFSSFYTSATAWPSPGQFCTTTAAPAIATCISSACRATQSAYATFTEISSSLCDRWSSCSSAGSTGVLTVTHTGGPGFGPGFGPGGVGHSMGPGGGFGPFGSGYCCGSDGNVVGPAGSGGGACPTNACTGPPFGYATSYPSGVYTITGCPFAGSPWYGGPGGLGGGKPEGWNGWGPWGHGWTFTATRTTTYTVTKTDNSGALITTTAVAVVAEAVSSGATSTVTLTGETALQTANAAAPDELGKVKAMGAALGVVVAVAGLM